MLAALISRVPDHDRTNFVKPWLWLLTIIGGFRDHCDIFIGVFRGDKRSNLITFIAAIGLMVLVVFVLHIERNLVHEGVVVGERFIRGAPLLVSLLFTNMKSLGLLLLLDPEMGEIEQPSISQIDPQQTEMV